MMIKPLSEFDELFAKMEDIQEGQDLTCNCKECYWNLWNPNFKDKYYASEAALQCVSESLAEIKMKPNTEECPGYWSYKEACGHRKETR
ncbi:hypothetical protein LG276_00940 [Cytobacillus kochii]|uniref:hypothetical protein n=2 Tax=Cytobacillus TaxID=2675230 RepID=UPI00384AA423